MHHINHYFHNDNIMTATQIHNINSILTTIVSVSTCPLFPSLHTHIRLDQQGTAFEDGDRCTMVGYPSYYTPKTKQTWFNWLPQGQRDVCDQERAVCSTYHAFIRNLVRERSHSLDRPHGTLSPPTSETPLSRGN